MAAITSPQTFYIVRMLLGVAEAGSFPGYWYYLTYFYPDSRITLPFAVTDSAVMVAQVCSAIPHVARNTAAAPFSQAAAIAARSAAAPARHPHAPELP